LVNKTIHNIPLKPKKPKYELERSIAEFAGILLATGLAIGMLSFVIWMLQILMRLLGII
jgi:hypothetical protein